MQNYYDGALSRLEHHKWHFHKATQVINQALLIMGSLPKVYYLRTAPYSSHLQEIVDLVVTRTNLHANKFQLACIQTNTNTQELVGVYTRPSQWLQLISDE